MPYTTISTASLAPGKPITSELLNAFRDRDDYLNGIAGTLQQANILNGAFEIDSDADGIPDNWTFAAFTGGTAALTTSTSLRGANSISITHPGGAGNGGGYLESDYFPVPIKSIRASRKITTTSLNSPIELEYFDRNLSSVYSTQIAINPATNSTKWRDIHIANPAPPTDAVYAKIRLYGGTTTGSVAGVAYWDDVRVIETFTPDRISANDGVSLTLNFTDSAAITGYETIYSTTITINSGDMHTVHIPHTTISGNATSLIAMYWRVQDSSGGFRNSATLSAPLGTTAGTYTTQVDFNIDISDLATGAYTLELRADVSTAVSTVTNMVFQNSNKYYYQRPNSTVLTS